MKALSSTSVTATTACFRAPPAPTSIVGKIRFSPFTNSLLGFLGQNFGLGNFEKRNSFSSDLPVYVTLPVIVPPAYEARGAARNATTARMSTVMNTPFFIFLPPYD